MKIVTFKVDDDINRELEIYAKKKNMTKSEIIRRALEIYLNNNKKRPFKTKRIKIYEAW